MNFQIDIMFKLPFVKHYTDIIVIDDDTGKLQTYSYCVEMHSKYYKRIVKCIRIYRKKSNYKRIRVSSIIIDREFKLKCLENSEHFYNVICSIAKTDLKSHIKNLEFEKILNQNQPIKENTLNNIDYDSLYDYLKLFAFVILPIVSFVVIVVTKGS